MFRTEGWKGLLGLEGQGWSWSNLVAWKVRFRWRLGLEGLLGLDGLEWSGSGLFNGEMMVWSGMDGKVVLHLEDTVY